MRSVRSSADPLADSGMSGHLSDLAPPEVSVRETELVPVMRRWLLAPGSPGVVGYVVAVAVTLVTLALEMALAGVFSSDGQGNVMLGFVGFVLLVVLVGAIPAAIIGAVGVFAVHVITLGAACPGLARPGRRRRGLWDGLGPSPQ